MYATWIFCFFTTPSHKPKASTKADCRQSILRGKVAQMGRRFFSIEKKALKKNTLLRQKNVVVTKGISFFAKNALRFHLKKPQFLKKLSKLLRTFVILTKVTAFVYSLWGLIIILDPIFSSIYESKITLLSSYT